MDAQPFHTAARIGLLGDVHGEMGQLLDAIRGFARQGVQVIVQLGDFGFLWPRANHRNNLNRITKALRERGMFLFWLDGNHEDFTKLATHPIDPATGLRPMTDRIAHLPRGYRGTLASGASFAVLGGAGSLDRSWRRRWVPTTWWPEEAISDADLTALGDAHADVLFGHEAPHGVFEDGGSGWNPHDLEYVNEVRAQFQRGFEAAQPRLSISGHWHRRLDRHIETTRADGETWGTRVIVLDQTQALLNPHSTAILDALTLDVAFVWSDGVERD